MNSKLTMVLRILMGLIFVVFGANKFGGFLPNPELGESAGSLIGAIINSGFMWEVMGVIYIIAGLLLIVNKAVPFALVLLAPMVVNIFLFHAVLDPAGLVGPSTLVAILQIALMYAHWDKFKGLFS
ncbi:DoxX family membrane protein [Spongiivirga citrea]|uniref:DoxX family membrane protein n=1 Tax=Spongiivirga citrea TaxID=1481457 RepID=A0A6M0CTX9_9FLAO|nr:DoxX family membrane protein [Spongiivirga citrea]NER17240.1 DoxX family membrane protein [Spongiivirga citrea]